MRKCSYLHDAPCEEFTIIESLVTSKQMINNHLELSEVVKSLIESKFDWNVE